jgi:hypothetical protein
LSEDPYPTDPDMPTLDQFGVPPLSQQPDRPTSVGNPPRGPWWQRFLKKAGVWLGIVAATLIFSAIVSRLAGVNLYVVLVPVILVAFGARFYYRGMPQVQGSRRMDPKLTHPQVENLWIDHTEFVARVLPYLGLAEHEKRLREPLKVEVVARRHWMLLVRRMFLPILVTLIVLVASLAVDAGKLWPALFLVLIPGVWGYFRWLYWRHSYYVLTNFRVFLIESIPAFWWWLESPNQNIPLQHVLTVNKSDTGMGNRYGYGGVRIDSAAEDDEPFKHIRWLPDHKRIVDITNAVIDARSERGANVSSP